MSKLSLIISTLVEDYDKPKLIELYEILKDVHTNDTSRKFKYNDDVLTITKDNLPPDSDYELIESIAKTTQQAVSTSEILTKTTTISLSTTDIPALWMGSLPKSDEIHKCIKTIIDAKDKKIPDESILVIPKLDGISCGIHFQINDDNDITIYKAVTRQQVVITNKIKELPTAINIKKLCDYLIKNNISDIFIRGEIIVKDKKQIQSAPAAYVSGKINGGNDVFQKSKNTLIFIPYEMMRGLSNKETVRFTQKEAFDLFQSICDDYASHILFKTMSKSEFEREFGDNTFECIAQLNTRYPLDGYVYCFENWQYPISKAATTDSVYGKYAWKPTSMSTAKIMSIEYNITRDNRIGLEINYTPFVLNGKVYKRTKTAISQIIALKSTTDFGIGSTVKIKLAGDISPYLMDILEPVGSYKIPKACPFCGSPTKLSGGKNPTLKCQNINCVEVLIQKYKTFLTSIGIKGIAEGKLTKVINVHSTKLTSLNKYKALRFSNISNDFQNINIRNTVINTPITKFFQACGFGGAQTVLKLFEGTPLIDKYLSNVGEYLDDVFEVMSGIIQGKGKKAASKKSDDWFILDCLNLISSI